MISIEQVIGFALKDPTVMDQLGEALSNDLVVAHSFYRRIVQFADGFLLERRKLPGAGDWEVWIESLEAGMMRDGTKEALGRLWATSLPDADASFFCAQVIAQLQRGAAQNAKARLNELGAVEPEAFALLSEKVASVRVGNVQGLARLSDVEKWAHARRQDDQIVTGYPMLDRLMGGWGKELWISFADTGVGKSMLLQNFATNVAVRSKKVLHISLELGVAPQIRRYYRQIAQASAGEFARDENEIKRRLKHWFKFIEGDVLLLEYPAYALTTEDLYRTIERVNRSTGPVDVLVLDYLDLLAPPKHVRGRGAYEELGYLTHQVRALCGQFDLTVLTASQAVRRPQSKNRLTMRDMGDSYKKVQGADGLLSLVQTDEEAEMHQGRLGVLKVRDSGGRGVEVALYINRDLSLISELEHPNTRHLMQSLGHLPEQLIAAKKGATP